MNVDGSAFIAKIGEPPPPDIADISLSQRISTEGVVMPRSGGRTVAGTRVIIALSIINNGPGPARGVRLTDNIPAGISFVSAGSRCSYAAGANRVTCSWPSPLASGGRSTATSTIIFDTTARGSLTNTATVISATPDPVSANNSATGSVTVGR